MPNFRVSLALLLAIFTFALTTQLSKTVHSQSSVPQSPSPMVEHTRPHPRLKEAEAPGRRIELQSLPGARLFIGPRVNANQRVPLLIHFHGAPWLFEQHVARHLPRAVLITVQLGSGSSVYRRPFQQSTSAPSAANTFVQLINEAARVARVKQGWSTITLSGFSAGYGAVREILRNSDSFALVNNVLLLDGMHTSYEPEGKLVADGGKLDPAGLDSFLAFAREAVAGRKTFVVTHSEIFPGAYASTTECADYLLGELRLKRRATLRHGSIGMQQLSTVDAGGFHLRGYAGNSAQDHVDHPQAMPAWFSLMRFQ